jgi:multiple antibiotic resistance protein
MDLIFATIAALLPIINPFSTAPLFLSLTDGYSDKERNLQGGKGVIYMIAILLVSLVGGSLIMQFFGLSLPGMRIAGGILVCGVGLKMLAPKDGVNATKEEAKEADEKKDISFTPLAMPSLSGPGAMSVVIGMSSLIDHVYDYAYIAAGILVVALVVFIVLRSATKMVDILGVNGLHAMTKIMGFIILCVGIQFIIHGTMDIITGKQMFEFLRKVNAA